MIDDSTLHSFMALFKGRTDRWGTITPEGKGTSVPGPVTDQTYRDHLEGKISLGCYPLLDDNTIWWGAIDLDWHNPEKDGPPDFNVALKVRNTFTEELKMPAYIANSKSLKGFHIYCFFEEPVLAADFRKIAIQLLNRLDLKNTEIFPKQDKVDNLVKYGNYINLPYFGDSPRKFLTTEKQPLDLATALPLFKRISSSVVVELAQKIITQRAISDIEKELKKPKPKRVGKYPPCIATIIRGVSRGMRDVAAFTLASHYLTDQGLTQDETLIYLEKWNALNDPPLDTRDLIEKVQSAGKGYDVGCRKIKEEPLLAGFCVGEDNCPYIQGINKEKIKMGKLFQTSAYETETHLYEQIIKDGKAVFAAFEKKTGLLIPVENVIDGDIEIRPFPIEKDGELYQSKTVLPVVTLPTGVIEYNSEQELVDELYSIIEEYVDIPKDDILFSTYYVMMTWVYDRLNTLSYLRFMGDIGCITGDSRVLLSLGQQSKIQSLGCNHLDDIDVRLQLFGQKGALVAKANKFFKYLQQPVLEIITETGKCITGSYNHPLLVKKVENSQVKSEWKRLDELKVGDKLKMVTKIQDRGQDNKTSCDYAGFLGYLLGDGHMRKTKHEISLYITDTEKELIPKLTKMIENHFGVKPTYNARSIPGKRVMHLIGLSTKKIVSTIPNQGIENNKKVPEIIWGSSHEALASFLRWLYTAEGSVNSKGRSANGIILSQNNLSLLRDIQLLLLRFGIHSRINKNSTGYNLLIRRSESIKKFIESIGFETYAKQEKLKILLAKLPEQKLRVSQPWEKIVSIKDAGFADVYDLHVPEHHRFVANGFISHNTGKSTCLDVIGKLCYKPMMAAGAVTPAPIYRIIRKFGGTLILDESDMKFTDVESDMTKILNCGVMRGRSVLRCVMDDQEKMIASPVYCPKVFSTRGTFTDKALESRCLTILTEKTDRDLPIADGNKYLARCELIRNKLLVWRFRTLPTIDGEDAINIKLTGLEPRLKQIARPMALIFKDKPEVRAKFENWMQVRQRNLIDEKAESPAGHAVHALFRLARTMGRCYVTIGAVAKMLSDEYRNEFKSTTVGRIFKSLKISNKEKRYNATTDGQVVSKVAKCVIWDPKLMKKILNTYFQIEDREEYKDLLEPLEPHEGDYTTVEEKHKEESFQEELL